MEIKKKKNLTPLPSGTITQCLTNSICNKKSELSERDVVNLKSKEILTLN